MKKSGLLITALLMFALHGCGGAEERKTAYLDKAEQSLKAGNFEKARIEIKNVLQIDPKDARAYFKLGNIFERQKEYKKSLANYNNAVELDPDNLEYQSKIGLFYLILANNIEKATEKMNLVLSKDKADINGLMLKAGILGTQGKTKEAKQVSAALFESHPESMENALLLSKLYLKEKQYSDAIRVLEKNKNWNPDNQQLLTRLADVHFINKDFNKTEMILKDIVNTHPDVLQNYLHLAQFYSQTNELEKAEETLRSAINADEEDVKRKAVLVGFIKRTKGNDYAIKELESLIQSNPEESVYRFALAKVQIVDNDIDAAISTLKIIAKEFSEEEAGVTSRVQLANLYMQKEDVKSAKNIIDEAVYIAPNDSEVNLVKAKLALHNKNFEQAIISLRTVVKDYPEKFEAYVLLSLSHKANMEGDQAKVIINKAYENNRDNIKVLLPLADYHLRNNNVAVAEKIIDDYLRLDADNYDALSIKSSILNINKNYDEGFEVAEKLVNRFPELENGYIQSLPSLLSKNERDDAIKMLSLGYSKTNSIKIIKIKARLLMSTGKINDSIAVLNAVAERDVDGSVHQLLAKAHMANKDIGSVKTTLMKSIKQDSSRAEAYIGLTGVYASEKNMEQALSVLNDGYEKTNSIKILKLKTQFLIQLGKVNDAIVSLNASTENDKDESIHLLLAKAYMINKDMDAAKKTLSSSIKQDRSRTKSYIKLSNIYASEKNMEQAIYILSDGVNTNPKDINLIIALAGMYEKTRNFEKSVQMYESILVDNSDDLLVINNLASLLSEHRTDSRSLSRAIELAEKLKDAKKPILLDTAGWVYYKTGNYSRAIKILKLVVEGAPDHAIFNYHLGMAYYKNKDKDSARTYLSKAVKSESDFTGRNEAEELLKGL